MGIIKNPHSSEDKLLSKHILPLNTGELTLLFVQTQSMYSGDQLIRGIMYPNKIVREINRFYFTRGFTQEYNYNGINVFDQDWDNLIILDACRHDMLARFLEEDRKESLTKVTSRGSHTIEFLKGNLSDRSLLDTVYISGTPQLTKLEQQGEINLNLHRLVDIWLDEGWDKDLGTVQPETMVKYGKQVSEEFKNKRLVFHFLQPHYPFLTDSLNLGRGHMQGKNDNEPNFWSQIFRGNLSVSPEQIWKAYNKSLEKTLPHVWELVSLLSGKTVITADHGNMIGERSFPIPIKEWGHPPGIHTPELVNVPWLEVGDEERRTITEERKKSTASVSSNVIESRLESLGYK